MYWRVIRYQWILLKCIFKYESIWICGNGKSTKWNTLVAIWGDSTQFITLQSSSLSVQSCTVLIIFWFDIMYTYAYTFPLNTDIRQVLMYNKTEAFTTLNEKCLWNSILCLRFNYRVSMRSAIIYVLTYI